MIQLTQKARLQQELKITPQLMQSMEILQMNSDELIEYLNEACRENPVLEYDDSSSLQKEYDSLKQKISWLDAGPHEMSRCENKELGYIDREVESLGAFLYDQLERKRLPQRLLTLCKYLADLLDVNGWLDQEDLDNLYSLKIPVAIIDQAIEELQSLEPAGVGARNLSECLLLQLRRLEGVPGGAGIIAENFLEELSRGNYRSISRKTGLSLEEVYEARDFISQLNPHPGQSFQLAEPDAYVRPDIFVVELDGELRVVINEYYLPRVSISDYYGRLLEQSDEKETKEYLQQKMQQAKWILQGLERRGNTLQACGNAIIEAHKEFFLEKSPELVALNLENVAQSISVHPSTVSRAIRGKYLQCRQGTYPLRYFFNRTISGNGPSQQAIRHNILMLIQQEPLGAPLSDQKLCDLLAEKGYRVARRTVTKYREQLGIDSSSIRKNKQSHKKMQPF